MRWYNLNPDHTVEPLPEGVFPDFQTPRHVGDDTIDGQRVSTVFLQMDHGWWDSSDARPVLFETMIFGGEYDNSMWRYHTWDEAKEGHDKIVHCLKHGINPNEVL